MEELEFDILDKLNAEDKPINMDVLFRKLDTNPSYARYCEVIEEMKWDALIIGNLMLGYKIRTEGISLYEDTVKKGKRIVKETFLAMYDYRAYVHKYTDGTFSTGLREDTGLNLPLTEYGITEEMYNLLLEKDIEIRKSK